MCPPYPRPFKEISTGDDRERVCKTLSSDGQKMTKIIWGFVILHKPSPQPSLPGPLPISYKRHLGGPTWIRVQFFSSIRLKMWAVASVEKLLRTKKTKLGILVPPDRTPQRRTPIKPMPVVRGPHLFRSHTVVSGTIGAHVTYGITRCYLPSDRGDVPALTPTGAGSLVLDLSTPGGTKGWVDSSKTHWIKSKKNNAIHQMWICND